MPNVRTLSAYVNTYAFSLAKSHQVPEALAAAQAGLALWPESPKLNYLYGILEIPVNRDVALRCWRLALKTDPNYSRCNASLGHELLKDGAFLEAIPLLQRALPEMEYAGQVWLDLAEAQISIGDLGEAQRSLARAKSAKVAPNPSQMESLTKRLMQATSGRMMTTR